MNDAFTSTAATNAIAQRAVRDAVDSLKNPYEGIYDIVQPLIEMYRDRGKISRSELRPIFERLRSRLASVENVIGLQVGRFLTNNLSVNESYQLRYFKIMGGNKSIGFLAMELSLTRHAIKVYVTPIHFHVHSHMLARFMQREQKPHIELVKRLMRPMRMALMIGQELSEGDIALPVSSGLILGTAFPTESKTPLFPVTITFNKNGHAQQKNEEDVIEIHAMMMTFIDRNSMSETKERLLNRLIEWEQEHFIGIARWFEANVFETLLLEEGDTKESIHELIKGAKSACIDLINSPQWRAVTKQERYI